MKNCARICGLVTGLILVTFCTSGFTWWWQNNNQPAQQSSPQKTVEQEEIERETVLMIQNLSAKTKLTRADRKKLKSIYKPMPMTEEEYKKIARDVKRTERQNSKPIPVPDEKLVQIDAPRFVIQKYNSPPGIRNIDLRALKTNRQINSIGVVSPNKDKLAYTTVYYEGYHDKVSSEVFYIDLDTSKTFKKSITEASLVNKKPFKLLETGLDEEYTTLFRTHTIIDWSNDGTKIAVKERIGSSSSGIWETHLWVYDIETQTARHLKEVREAIHYNLKQKQNLYIDDYRWDIVPLGWDEIDKNRIIVAAYAYTKKKATKFLGLYSVDADGKNTQLISEKPISVSISANGLILKSIPTAF